MANVLRMWVNSVACVVAVSLLYVMVVPNQALAVPSKCSSTLSASGNGFKLQIPYLT
ncbi:MAG: hypothetical protein WCP10_15755 [Desulfuromonadales bacterium]